VIYDFEVLDLDNILTESKLGKLVLFSYDVICCIHVLLLIIDHKKPDEFPREKMDKVEEWFVYQLSVYLLCLLLSESSTIYIWPWFEWEIIFLNINKAIYYLEYLGDLDHVIQMLISILNIIEVMVIISPIMCKGHKFADFFQPILEIDYLYNHIFVNNFFYLI
jgi:hypothetical protein